MVMTNFLQERKSVRDFKGKSLSAKDLEQVNLVIEKANEEGEARKISFRLFQNGAVIYKKLEGKAGYGGVMIDAPHYISMEMGKEDEETLLAGGYALEKLNTGLIKGGLGTCWITVDEVDGMTKQEAFGKEGGGVQFIIAIGYPKGKKLFTPETSSARKEVGELVFKDKIDNPASIEELENLGLFDILSSVRYAPSHKNFQPWRFLIDGTEMVLLMKRSSEDRRSLVDMGVVMFYFEEMAKTIGINHKWSVSEEEDLGGYKVVGRFKL